MRYSPWGDGIDDTWGFALNYTASHGLWRDAIFTYGVLGFLTCPMDLGSNLAVAFLFQAGVWLVLAWILRDWFFRASVSIRNLAWFVFFWALSAPFLWFSDAGLDNVLAAAVLLFLVDYYFHGLLPSFLLALCLTAIAALIKLNTGLLLALALAGFLIARFFPARRIVWREAALAAVIPVLVYGTVSAILIPSGPALLRQFHASLELAAGYSAAMSQIGSRTDLYLALLTAALLFSLLHIQAKTDARSARFQALLLAGPALVAFKHGFVRPDTHATIFFGFAALGMGLVGLHTPLSGRTLAGALVIAFVFVVIWAGETYQHMEWMQAEREIAGIEALQTTWSALHFRRLQRQMELDRVSVARKYPIDPRIRAVVGNRPVAPLSVTYAEASAAGLELRLYPVFQRYSAYTPYLDRINANWIRDRGPDFLLFDGDTIDERDPWAESPATWLEVYRWYNTRLLSADDLLLQRRATPRIAVLEVVESFDFNRRAPLHLPPSNQPQFWTLTCRPTLAGELGTMLLRAPPVTASLVWSGRGRTARVIPGLMVSPMITSMPESLQEFAAVFDPNATPLPPPEAISFDAEGYSPTCRVEIFEAR